MMNELRAEIARMMRMAGLLKRNTDELREELRKVNVGT